MSKISTPTPPSQYYGGGQVSINGNPKATANFQGGMLNSNYNMNEYEKAIYEYSQSALAQMLPQLNTFSPEVMNAMQQQLGAYQNQGINMINQTYTPMISNMKNDIASRFGNFDNSMFMNNLNSIESKRADAVSGFAQDVLARQSQLMSEEMNRRYGLAEFMASMQGLPLQNANSFLDKALNSANQANSYNNNLYNNMYKQYMQGLQTAGNIAGAIGSKGSSLLPMFL